MSAVPTLALADVRKNFGATQIIRGVTLNIAAGERHAIIGPNGAGKTTLFNLMSGRFPITSGAICPERHAHRPSAAAAHQPAGPVAQLSNHLHLPSP